MNIVLFEEKDINNPIPLSDKRGYHIKNILKFKQNDVFDAGIINGKKGKGYITEITGSHIFYRFEPVEVITDSKKNNLILITAFARPPEAKKILKNITTIGVSSICFIRTLNSERSYMDSTLWKNENYREYLIDGATQAFATDIPEIHLFPSLKQCINSPLIIDNRERIALDNYEAVMSLPEYRFSPLIKVNSTSQNSSNTSVYISGSDSDTLSEKTILAVGGERGWSTKERYILRENSFTLCSLGNRILKTETACVAGISIINTLKGIY